MRLFETAIVDVRTGRDAAIRVRAPVCNERVPGGNVMLILDIFWRNLRQREERRGLIDDAAIHGLVHGSAKDVDALTREPVRIVDEAIAGKRSRGLQRVARLRTGIAKRLHTLRLCREKGGGRRKEPRTIVRASCDDACTDDFVRKCHVELDGHECAR